MATLSKFQPVTCVVNFHHARGPVVERWFSDADADDPALEAGWDLLPFFALPDKSHEVEEEISCFSLRRFPRDGSTPFSVFGISCTRHCPAAELTHQDPDVTRTSVQKAVVVVVDSPYKFSRIREKLSAVTQAWFAGKDLSDFTIISQFQESIIHSTQQKDDENDQYFGLSLRQLLREYRHQTLVMLKCCLLQPKMLFFGSHCEKLCLLQFALISLIPGLLRNLQDSADPLLNTFEMLYRRPASLKTSERTSLLAYMGFPFQLFGKGSLFSPYAPLQQLDTLADRGTKSYIVGSMNNLLLMQRERYCDVMIDADERKVEFMQSELKSLLSLTASDRRWVDFLTQSVNETWDDANPMRPTTYGYAGSEEFIRLQFEEYLLALASSVRYQMHFEGSGPNARAALSETYGDPASDFGPEWIGAWRKTDNFRIFCKYTDDHLFDVIEPKHPCAGGLTIEDVQRRISQQVADLHLDERFTSGRETIGKHISTGQKRVSSAFSSIWADIEAMREAQRKRGAVAQQSTASAADAKNEDPENDERQKVPAAASKKPGPDFSKARENMQLGAQKAGAYLSSWGSWASQVSKDGWNKASSTYTRSDPQDSTTNPQGST